MDEKASFIFEWGSGESTVSALCESLGISRTLAYRYIACCLDYGCAGLAKQSRAPQRVWNRTDEDLVQAVVELRRRKPRLGALKFQKLLQGQCPDRELPAVSTIEPILRHHGLVKKREQVRRASSLRQRVHVGSCRLETLLFTPQVVNLTLELRSTAVPFSWSACTTPSLRHEVSR